MRSCCVCHREIRIIFFFSRQRSGSEALCAIDELRKLPPPVRDDPRIDLAEAETAERANDFQREREFARRAAGRAADVGALLLVARARVAEGASAIPISSPRLDRLRSGRAR
jgi:hypothetical protein